MNRFCTVISLAALMLFALNASAQQAQFFTILHMNDTHSNLLPGGPRTAGGDGTIGGIARAASVIQKEKAKDQPVLTLHAGDMFTGDPFFSEMLAVPELQLLAGLGLDAMTLGNHEFDLSPAALEGAVGMAFGGTGGFPLLSANVYGLPDWTNFPALSQLWSPSTIVNCGNLKIGIVGLTIPSPFSQYFPLTISSDLVTIAGAQASLLKAPAPAGNGCDVVILLSHCGMANDVAIANGTSGIDIIIGGHDHFSTTYPQSVNGVIVAQAGAFYRQMGKMRIKVHKGNVQLHQYSLIDLDQSVPEDPFVKGTVNYLAGGLPSSMFSLVGNNPLFMAEEELSPGSLGYHDTPVGSLVADAFLAYTGADLALEPGGSTAQPIYPGPVLTMDLFRTIGYGFDPASGGSIPGLPNLYGFPVVTFDLPGWLLAGLLDGTLADLGSDEMLMQVSENVYYQYAVTGGNSGTLTGMLIDGAPIDFYQDYTIATNLLVYYFVEQQLALLPSPVPVVIPTFWAQEYLVLEDYLVQNGFPSSAYVQNRIEAVPPPAPKQAASAPAAVELAGASPNPFDAQTTVHFAIRKAGHVSLRVYDVTGREVAVLADGVFQAGSHHQAFAANGLPAGIYFCVLRANGIQEIQKMLLAR